MILHSLRLKPMHGYALVKHIKKVSDDLLQIEQESLYPAFRRLLSEDGVKHLKKARSSFEKRLAGISRVIAVQ